MACSEPGMVVHALAIAVVIAVSSVPGTAADRLRPVEVFDEALREVWPQGMSPSGSGFPVAPGLVLTAAHVIAGCRVMWVRSPTIAQSPATLLGIDTRVDVALLWVAGLRGRSGVPPALVTERDGFLLRGFPKRRGRVMDVPYAIPAGGAGYVDEEATGPILELVARGPEGISGGPVIDRAGRAVGMVVAKRRGGEERVLAIPSDRLADFLAYMGVVWAPADRPAAAEPEPDVDAEFVGAPWPLPRPRPRPNPVAEARVTDVLQIGCSR
jgi:S1-C subfamily serine protease